MSFGDNLAVWGLIVCVIGIGIAILWPTQRWLGWLCIGVAAMLILGWVWLSMGNRRSHAHEMTVPGTQPNSGVPSSKPTPPPAHPPNGELPSLEQPPLYGTDQFITYIMVDSNMGVQCANVMGSPLRAVSCADIQAISKGRVENQNVSPSLSVVLQHYFPVLVWTAGTDWGSRSSAPDGRFAETYIAPIEDPPDSVKYVPSKLIDLSSDEEHFYPWWFLPTANVPNMKLPKGTELSLLKERNEQEQQDYVLRLERKGYYQLDLSTYGFGAPLNSTIPEGYEISTGVNTSLLTTYRFVVRIDWTIQRSHGPSFDVGAYNRWAKELFNNIRPKLVN
jgi:hypothetical protein